jgi:hypothetical protein
VIVTFIFEDNISCFWNIIDKIVVIDGFLHTSHLSHIKKNEQFFLIWVSWILSIPKRIVSVLLSAFVVLTRRKVASGAPSVIFVKISPSSSFNKASNRLFSVAFIPTTQCTCKIYTLCEYQIV